MPGFEEKEKGKEYVDWEKQTEEESDVLQFCIAFLYSRLCCSSWGHVFSQGHSLRYPLTIFSGSHSENLLFISCVDTGLHPFITGCKGGRNRLLWAWTEKQTGDTLHTPVKTSLQVYQGEFNYLTPEFSLSPVFKCHQIGRESPVRNTPVNLRNGLISKSCIYSNNVPFSQPKDRFTAGLDPRMLSWHLQVQRSSSGLNAGKFVWLHTPSQQLSPKVSVPGN